MVEASRKDYEMAFAAAPEAVEKLIDPKTQPEAVAELAKAANQISQSRALESDKWCYRTAILALGAVVVFTVMGAIALTVISHAIPEILIALGSAAVGALAGLVTPNVGGSK